MIERNQHKPSLTQIYRRFAAGQGTVSVPDADDVLQLARTPHAEDAAAPVCADLLRFSRELESTSAQLSHDVDAALQQSTPHTHRRIAARRAAAAGARRWRGVAAIAASLLAVIGAWSSLKHRAPLSQHAPMTSKARTEDRIFAGLNEGAGTGGAARNDVIFRGEFVPDEIFNSSQHNG